MDNIYKECPAKMEDARFLTDYRSSNTREQYIRSINALTGTNEYRSFLQDNAEQIMDREWGQITDKNSCKATTCVATAPSRPVLGTNNAEMQLYNMIQSGKIKQSDAGYPTCKTYEDYRMTDTKGTKY